MKIVDALTVTTGLCAVLLTGLTLRDRVKAKAALDPEIIESWHTYAQSGHSYGSDSAAVTLVQFSDYQCPACRALNLNLATILSERSDVRVVYRNYPLAMHEHARMAALASECAAAQGRFRQYHDLLYERQDSILPAALTRWANDAAIPDHHEFLRCLGGVVDPHGIVRRQHCRRQAWSDRHAAKFDQR